MQPNYPTQTPGPTLDYLNSIAPQQQQKTMNPFVLWGIIAAVLIVMVLAIVGMASGGNSSTNRLAQVGATGSNLKELSKGADKNIKSSELRSLNSNLNLVLANLNRDLSEPLKVAKISLANKKDKTVLAVTSEFDAVNKRLEDARLNGIYDRTYAREVTYLLKLLHSDMEKLYNQSKNKAFKQVLLDNDNSLEPLLKGFQTFNDS